MVSHPGRATEWETGGPEAKEEHMVRSWGRSVVRLLPVQTAKSVTTCSGPIPLKLPPQSMTGTLQKPRKKKKSKENWIHKFSFKSDKVTLPTLSHSFVIIFNIGNLHIPTPTPVGQWVSQSVHSQVPQLTWQSRSTRSSGWGTWLVSALHCSDRFQILESLQRMATRWQCSDIHRMSIIHSSSFTVYLKGISKFWHLLFTIILSLLQQNLFIRYSTLP